MKKRKLGRKLLSWLLTLAMVVGLMPGMGLTALAYEGDPYAGLVNTTTEITFDGKSWYLIDYDESTVTLLSKECVGASEFGEENTYDGSTVESAVNDYYEESISTDAKTAVSDNKMFLLSTDEAEIIYNANPDVLKCSKASDAEENIWWLRSQGYDYYYAAVVNVEDGEVDEDGENLSNKLGVRPALKLDLSKVTFDSNTFTVNAAAQEANADLRKAIVDFFTPFYYEFVKELIQGDSWGGYPVRGSVSATYNGENADIAYSPTSENSGDITISHGGNELRFYVSIETDPETGNNTTVVGPVTYTGDEPTAFSLSFDPAAVDLDGSVRTSVYPAPAATYVVAGSHADIFGTVWDATNEDNTLSLAEDGTYQKTYTVSQAYDDINLKVVKNYSWAESYGDAQGYNVIFSLPSAGSFTVIFNPATGVVSVRVAHTHDDINFTAWTATDSMPTEAGNYYLANDVTISSTWNVPAGTTNLCLNGHGILMNRNDRVIHVSSGCTLNLYDCGTETVHKFTVNNPSAKGAGLATVNDSLESGYQTFTGGYITGGKEEQGGGVYVDGGTFNMAGGNIIGNKATAGGYTDGGGVSLSNNANSQFVMTGGAISYNTSTGRGPALGIAKNATVELTGDARITHNSRDNNGWCGGISSYGNLTISGNVQITNNRGQTALHPQEGSVNISGSPVIFDNEVSAGDIHLDITLNIVGELTEGAKLGVYWNNAIVFTNSTDTSFNDASKFVSDNPDYSVMKNADGQLYLGTGYTVTFDAGGHGTAPDAQTVATGSKLTKPTDPTAEGYAFDGWYKEEALTNEWDFDSDTVTENITLYAKWSNIVASVTTSGGVTTGYADLSAALNNWTEGSTLKLYADANLNSTITVNNTKTLDLNGFGMIRKYVSGSKGSRNQGVFDVMGGNLTIIDSNADVVHRYKPATDGAGRATDIGKSDGTASFKGGYITGDVYGVSLGNQGTLNFKGGTIIGHERTGIWIEPGTLNMSDNAAIIANSSWGNGGGVELENGTFKMTGGTISNNMAKNNGGGVFCAGQNTTLQLLGGSITGNVVKNYFGGGVNSPGSTGTFEISGNVSITDNKKSDGTDNNVWLWNGAKISITGALSDGAQIGIIMNTPGVFTSSSTVSNNDASKFSSDNNDYSVFKNADEQLCLGISYTVTFKVVNGSWNDETSADKTVTLTGYEGDTLKLAATDIPAVGSKPNDTYKVGSWDVTPNTDTAITEATTYTYTYVAKEASVVTKAPEAKTLTYNGQAQELVTAGTATGGEMQYALGTKDAATEEYTTTIPSKTDAGTYYVWYMVVGNENYNDSEPACVEVTVSTNKAAMSEEIDAADNFYNEIKEDYPEIADELSRVIKDAVAVKDNPDATQDEINAAEKAVKDATSNAKEILIQINHFVEGINDITQVGEDNKDDIKDLLASYDELPDSVRTAVDNKIGRAGTKKLSDLEDALEVVDKIDSIETAENIKLSDEEAVTIARTAYELLSESEKALISGDVIEKLEAAEAKIEELKNNEALNAAKASAIGRLEDYVDAKALSDATQDEDKAIKDVVDAEIEKINAAADMDAVAKALTAAKAAVDAALAKIAEDRAAAAAAAQEMAEADDAIADALVYADVSKADAAEAAADKYASGADKQDIATAMATLEGAINAAKQLAADASAADKNAAAQAVMDAAAALDQVVDAAKVRSAAAKAADEAAAAAAAQLDAAKDSAIDRLNDYSEAKALADATDTEKEAYNKAVTDGKTAIEAATTIEAVAAALANAKAAVDAALAKIAEDRAAAAAAAQEMAEADEAVADALVYADASKADAVEAAEDEYASNADKQDIATAKATLEGAINAAKQLAADASAETKREAAQAVMNAAAALDQVVDAAKVRSAAAKAAATELAAARASACERLDDYSEAKALADATDAEKEAYNKAVTDGKTAINAAATTEAVAEALKAAKAAVDAALAKIAEDRAAAAEAAAEMEEADESLEQARTIAGLAKEEAEKAANDEYASDTDKNAITTAKATLEGAINAAAQLAADASAEAKRAAAQTIVNAANALYDVCETAEQNSAAAKADAEAAAAAAAALAAAREYACERLDDFTDAKALDDATEAEQKEYDDVIAAEKEKINAAADQAAIDEALKAAKAAVNAELAKIKDDRTKAAAVVEMISGLPATEEIVLDDKEAVEAARTAYDALTDDQKLKVSDEVVKTLEDAEDMVVIRQVKSEIIARTGMIYNGQAFQLIDTPETDLPDGFTMMYAVTTENVEPDALEYAEDIPEAVEFGNYYVWFKVVDEQDNIWGGVSSVEVTIIRPTEIVTQPAAAKVIRGSKAKFSVEATGDDLTYVWQISKDGVNWSNSTASGCDTNKITFRATKALNGRYYRCVITGAGGVVISDAVKLTTIAVINGQPGDAAATIGSDVTFSVSSRSSAATYQWQVSTDGGETWKKSSAEGCDTDHLTVNVKSAKYGEYLFRCKVTNGTWVEYSKAAGIDIVTFIVKQPETIFASEGDKVKLYVKATGIAPTYQWEVMTGAGNWVNSTAPGNATNIITFKATAEKTAYKWRCKITDGDTVLYSDVVTLVIESGQYED